MLVTVTAHLAKATRLFFRMKDCHITGEMHCNEKRTFMRALQAPVIVFIIIIRIQQNAAAVAISLQPPVGHDNHKNVIVAPAERHAGPVLSSR